MKNSEKGKRKKENETRGWLTGKIGGNKKFEKISPFLKFKAFLVSLIKMKKKKKKIPSYKIFE